MNKRLMHFLLLALFALPIRQAGAELVVVANPKSGIDRLTQQEIIYLFMGRLRLLPSGTQAMPIDQGIDTPERANFYRRLVNKEPAEIKAYWSRLVFSGGSHPPSTADSRDELIRMISNNPGAIGYLERDQLDSRLRVIFEFPVQP
jgi:hypothetical protein